jgi:succinate dehydrogenase/fumarate reductase flavoprotein subunit
LAPAAVSGVIAGISAAEKASEMDHVEIDKIQAEELKRAALFPLKRPDGIEPDHVILALQEAIHPYYIAIIRHERRMKKALEEVERVRDTLVPLLHAYDHHYLMSANEARNMVQCAEIILMSALERKESRLACLREDYRELDNIDWLKYIHLRQENGQMKVWAEEVPVERYKLKPQRSKLLHPFWKKIQELGYSNTVEI